MPRKPIKKSRNEKGEGSLRKRPNGSFEYRIVYSDEYGQSERKSFYGKSDLECYEKAQAFLDRINKIYNGIDVNATIPDIIKTKYAADLEMNFVHEQGYERNMHTLSIIENKSIGKIPIIDISEGQIQLFLRSITDYSNSTITKVYRQIRLAYKEAFSKKIIDYNFMDSGNIRCPKSNKKGKKVVGLTQDEQLKLVEYLNNYRVPKNRNDYTAQILISLYSGMRMGEVNALKKDNIDFKNNVIKVRQTITRGEGYRTFLKDGVKTETGIRDIPISAKLKPILEKAIADAKPNKYDLVFYDIKNDKLITTNQVNSFFNRTCEKCGINIRGQHSLRHTFATRCIEAYVPAVVLKNWLGHADIHITLDTYADVFNSMHNDSISKLDDYISKLDTAS